MCIEKQYNIQLHKISVLQNISEKGKLILFVNVKWPKTLVAFYFSILRLPEVVAGRRQLKVSQRFSQCNQLLNQLNRTFIVSCKTWVPRSFNKESINVLNICWIWLEKLSCHIFVSPAVERKTKTKNTCTQTCFCHFRGHYTDFHEFPGPVNTVVII